MDWTSVSNTSLVGRILRAPLRLIPPRTVLPVLQGPLRGKKWIVGSGNHGYWLGSYEMAKCALFARHVPRGGAVFDLGANVGYYTILSALRAGPGGRVYAFEPLPRNLAFLKRHLALNRIENAVVIGAAVSDRSGTARFAEDSSVSKGRIGPDGSIEVTAVALDDWIGDGRLPRPDLLKIDVEGAEFQALQGARTLLASSHPTIFLSTHSGQAHRDCLALLESIGYRVTPVDGRPLERSRDILAAHSPA
jgi:FkbM family methyltransferase